MLEKALLVQQRAARQALQNQQWALEAAEREQRECQDLIAAAEVEDTDGARRVAAWVLPMKGKVLSEELEKHGVYVNPDKTLVDSMKRQLLAIHVEHQK